jgi:hypothetical protein
MLVLSSNYVHPQLLPATYLHLISCESPHSNPRFHLSAPWVVVGVVSLRHQQGPTGFELARENDCTSVP